MNQSLQNTVRGSVLSIPLKLMEFYNIDLADCFSTTGLDWEKLRDPELRVSFENARYIWGQAQQLIDDPCAGLNAIHFWHPSNIGALGYAMLTSTTLRTSLQRLVRYQQTVAKNTDITLTETDKGMCIMQNADYHQSGDFPMLVDAGMSSWLHTCRFNYSDVLDPVEVNLKRPMPDCKGRYYAMYRCPVNFSASENNLILPMEAMDEPLPNANRDLAHMHDQVLQQYLEQQQRGALVTQVRESIIDHLPSGEINKDQIAKALLMSNRTLQRRLQDEGTSFADILNETRRELAIKYIQDNSLPLTEVSYLLGFSDSTAFSRAFKRWTGKTPSESRVKS